MASQFNKHVVIIGSARSGTSWLSETLAQPFRYRMLFEPEHENRTEHGHLLCDKWLIDKATSVTAYHYLCNVFKNKVDSDWIAQNSNRKFKMHLWPFLPKKFIIKFVRFSLSSLYILENFNIPVVHLIRDPYDVIRSQQQVKFPWLYDLKHFTAQEHLVDFILRVYNYDIRNLTDLSEVEILTLRWCIENSVPIEHFDKYTDIVTVIKYEDLIKDTDAFYKLTDKLNVEVMDNLEGHYRSPSSKTHPKSFTYKQSKSQSELSEADIDSINGILKIFKTKLYKLRV